MLSTMGYREMELSGPFPFRYPDAIVRWNAVTPQRGFSDSGYLRRSASRVRAILEEDRVSAPSVRFLKRRDRACRGSDV